MATDDAAWTGKWVSGRLQNHDEVMDIELVAAQVIRVNRKKAGPFLAATIASRCVEPGDIAPILGAYEGIEFVANIPADAMWTGSAIELAEFYGAAFGGLGDLMSAISDPDVGSFVRKEFGFVERGLRQHSRVSRLRRIHDRKYVVERYGLPELPVVLMNEYDVTADHVRTARDRYGPFAAALVTNPNGRITSAAKEALTSMSAEGFKWGEFLGRLNRP